MPDPADVPRPWLAAYPPGVPATYRWPDVGLPRLLEDAARDFPDLPAVERGTGTTTWAELAALTDRVVAGLQAAGVTAGDRVGLATANGAAAVVTAFATWRCGAVLVLLDPDLPTPARDEVLDATTPRVTVTDRQAPWPATAGTVVVVTEEAPLAASGWRRLVPRRRRTADDPPTGEAWQELTAATAPPVPVAVAPDEPAVLAPTGGTTGVRRIVTLTHRNLVANAFQARLWVPDVQAGRERLLAATAFTHPYGLTVGLLAGTLAAATLVVPASTDGPALVRTIAEARPTLFPALPSLLVAIVEAGVRRRPDLSSLRVCLVGGAPLAPDVARRYRALSGEGRLREGYGVSEAGPLTHANPVYGRAHHGRGGLPVTGTASIVVDPDDPTVVLDPGQVGLLAVAGPQVMPGYWQDPEGTAAVLRDGWLLTGDLAVMDTAGHVGIVDRLVDVVVTAAGAVFPADVEQVLRLHPGVQDARVTGRGTTAGTDEVVAQVVVTGDVAGATAELVVHCRAHLPAHAVPVDIEVVRALPEGRTAAVVRRRFHPRVTDQEVAP